MPVATAHGIEIDYTDSGGQGPVVVFSHGFLMDRTMFGQQVTALTPQYRVITWDQRGHGGTRATGAFTYWDSAVDVLALLDHLGVERAVLAGMSQGGFVSLRATGIAFAMVTLAFAQAGAVLALKDPHHWTHGEEGLGADYTKLPQAFVGILNTKNLYWLALVYAAVVFVVGRWAINSSPGKVWQAIRENELRVEVLGMRPFDYKLMSCVLASFLATLDGIVYLMLISGASPDVTTPPFTLALLIMVVIGGTGSRWGALIGGVVLLAACGADKSDLPQSTTAGTAAGTTAGAATGSTAPGSTAGSTTTAAPTTTAASTTTTAAAAALPAAITGKTYVSTSVEGRPFTFW